MKIIITIYSPSIHAAATNNCILPIFSRLMVWPIKFQKTIKNVRCRGLDGVLK